MIHTHPLVSGSNYVELNWTRPKFLPKGYQLMYFCTMKPTSTPNYDMNNSVTANAHNLSSDTTFVRICDLLPGSICTLFLLAEYNPASIDLGIVITGTTLDEDTSKIRFHNNHHLLYMFIMLYIMSQTTSIKV